MPFLFFNDDGFITCLDSPDKFYNFFNNHEEVTPEYILSLEVEKKPKWKDFGKVSGYYVDTESGIIKVTNQYAGKFTKNTFPTQEEALACLALSQLCQWRDKYNDGWKPDWSDITELKSVIKYYNETLESVFSRVNRCILAFKTEEIKDEFLRDFEDLIEQAVMRKETFIKALEAIQRQYEQDCEKAELLEKVFPESFAANMMYDNRHLHFALLEVLAEAMNDTDNFIEHFLWELDFGKKGEKLEVKTADGKRHHLTDTEELYNFLKEYYDQSTSNI